MQIVPKTGLKGLAENWQSDLLAAISVSLVALPLGLGIALACGIQPMAGVWSAVVGGIVTTFYRGSFVGINGPSAGIIAVILASVSAMDDGSGHAVNYVLAAVVVSGAVQVLLGLLKLGRLADVFHPTVIRGILAAIGIVIFAKQIHMALGTELNSEKIIDDLIGVVKHIGDINPFVAAISLLGLFLLIFHSRISYKVFHVLPAPIWVLLLSVPLVYAFNFFQAHDIDFLGKSFSVGPDLLISIPPNPLDSIMYPDFSKIGTVAFWTSVLSMTMVSSIDSLASSKAVDKLDPYKRKTDLNKDLVGVGLSTMLSGAIGGLPVVTAIVRSTVNVHNHAKTKWSNFYHGILLLLFIFILAPFIQQVPLAALAILLVYTGFKLASPKVFKQVYRQGPEQLVFFVGTLIITIFTDLLIGIFCGLLLVLLVHFLLAKAGPVDFMKLIFKSGTNLFIKKDGSYLLRVKGVANFLGTLKMNRYLDEIQVGSKVKIDFSSACLVDLSVLESVHDFKRLHEKNGGKVDIQGLEQHVSSVPHQLAMKILNTNSMRKLTPREVRLKEWAFECGWNYHQAPVPDQYLESFYFFKMRPIEYKSNCIYGNDHGMAWEISDVTFDEGAYLALERYKITLEVIKLPFEVPKFTIEKKGLMDKYLILAEHKDIDYVLYSEFSNDFKVRVEDQDQMRSFLSEPLQKLIEGSEIHHIESNGEAILIFNDHLGLADMGEYQKMVRFSEELRGLLK
ncbi:MAG: SulP family inorganic anion transporter [Bacteroidetes bacterium]|nr:MAG: SulP family inorganic anion transporter [Bacteroidota bacterium]